MKSPTPPRAAADPIPSPSEPALDLSSQPLAVALAGMVSLGVAMGIGRFAFTPLLPMMLHDGVLSLAGGSWLATANYVGYLVGALACMALPWVAPRARQVWHAARLARVGLAATVLLTLGMALPVSAAWPLLRFAAGVASALVFLNVSVWCMVRLVSLGQPALGGLIFCGPGWASSSRACLPARWWPGAGLRRPAGRSLGCCPSRCVCPSGRYCVAMRCPPNPLRPPPPPRRGLQWHRRAKGRWRVRVSPWLMAWPGWATSSRPRSCR